MPTGESKGERWMQLAKSKWLTRVLPWSADCICGRRPLDDSDRMCVRPESAFMRLSPWSPVLRYLKASPHHRMRAGMLVRFFFFLLKFFIFLAEAFNAAGGIYQLLLAGKKRMAFWTNLNPDILSGGSCLQKVTTGAPNGSFMILWMNVSFHFISTP